MKPSSEVSWTNISWWVFYANLSSSVSWTRRSVSIDHLEKKSFVSHCELLRQCCGGVGPTSPMILIITYFHMVFWCESFYTYSWHFGTYLIKLNEIKFKPCFSKNARNVTTFWDGLWDKWAACQKQLLVGLHDVLCRSMWNWFACVYFRGNFANLSGKLSSLKHSCS